MSYYSKFAAILGHFQKFPFGIVFSYISVRFHYLGKLDTMKREIFIIK